MKISVITVSDSCFKDPSLDTSGPILSELLKNSTYLREVHLQTLIVADDLDQV